MRATVDAGPGWKLAICEACRKRRMMPRGNTSCLRCEGRPRLCCEPDGGRAYVDVPALRVLREARGFTVSELARVSSVDYTTVVRLEERGATSNPQRAQSLTARKLADALGVEVGELAGRLRRDVA